MERPEAFGDIDLFLVNDFTGQLTGSFPRLGRTFIIAQGARSGFEDVVVCSRLDDSLHEVLVFAVHADVRVPVRILRLGSRDTYSVVGEADAFSPSVGNL